MSPLLSLAVLLVLWCAPFVAQATAQVRAPGRSTRTSIPILANMLTQQTGASVKDETGLNNTFAKPDSW
jgi:hypothetical protein